MVGQNLGLLQGLNGLAPNAAQPTANAAAPDYSTLVQNKYNAAMANSQSKQAGIGQLLGTGLGLLTAPLTGAAGLGNSIAGRAVGSLFNGGSPQYASNSTFNLNNLY